MNTKLLRKVQKAIEANPAHFDITTWGWGATKGELIHDEPKSSRCGTTACIAGWACALTDGQVTDMSVGRRGQEVLGLDEEQAARLFYASDWPVAFYRRFLRANRNATLVRIAVERIDHFIATKGAE